MKNIYNCSIRDYSIMESTKNFKKMCWFPLPNVILKYFFIKLQKDFSQIMQTTDEDVELRKKYNELSTNNELMLLYNLYATLSMMASPEYDNKIDPSYISLASDLFKKKYRREYKDKKDLKRVLSDLKKLASRINYENTKKKKISSKEPSFEDIRTFVENVISNGYLPNELTLYEFSSKFKYAIQKAKKDKEDSEKLKLKQSNGRH